MGVEVVPLVADHDELAGLVGGDQERGAQPRKSAGKLGVWTARSEAGAAEGRRRAIGKFGGRGHGALLRVLFHRLRRGAGRRTPIVGGRRPFTAPLLRSARRWFGDSMLLPRPVFYFVLVLASLSS